MADEKMRRKHDKNHVRESAELASKTSLRIKRCRKQLKDLDSGIAVSREIVEQCKDLLETTKKPSPRKKNKVDS